jgi:hypothetical protein
MAEHRGASESIEEHRGAWQSIGEHGGASGSIGEHGAEIYILGEHAERGDSPTLEMEDVLSILTIFVEGMREGLWDPLVTFGKCCHITADCILWLFVQESNFTYVGTMMGQGCAPSSASLSKRFVAQRLRFVASLDEPCGADVPVAMLRFSLSCGRSRRNTHTLACLVHCGHVLVLQAARGTFSLYDWVQEDSRNIPASLEIAHRKYGGARWVAVTEFIHDAVELDFLPVFGLRCPRVGSMSLMVHEKWFGTRASRGFNDSFVHGRNVERVLPAMTWSVGCILKRFFV